MSPELKVGIIGCGNISTTYLELASLFTGYRIVACADQNHEAAVAQGEAHGATAMSVEQLLASADIDLVINLTVPDVHAEISRNILLAGKHAYSEKPLVLSLEEGLELQALAKRQGKLVGCAPDTFFGGAHQLARNLVDDGCVGEITSGTCHVMNHGMEHWHPNPDFFYQPGAGPMLDLGPYYIANLINLIGPVKQVAALSSSAAAERVIANGDREGETVPVDTPTNIHALLQFHTGAIITLSSSWDVWAHEHNNMELYGTQGTVYVPDPNFFAGTVRLANTEGESRTLDALEHPFNVLNQEHEEGDRANYRGAGLADMARAIRSGGDLRCSLERTLHGVDVMVSILKSAETKQFVPMHTSCTRPEPVTAAEAKLLMR